MASSQTVLKGAEVVLFLNGKIYGPTQSINYTINYNETAIYGIDDVFPQEIATTKITCSGTVNGLIVKQDGLLIGRGFRPLISDANLSPYIALRIQDRNSNIDILTIPSIKIVSETVNIQARGVANISFSFTGVVPKSNLDA